MCLNRPIRWLAVTSLCGVPAIFAMPTLSLGTTAGTPGSTNPVPISVTIDTNVVSFQFDLLYATNYLTPGPPVGGSALADQQLASAEVSPGLFRVLGFSFSNSPLTNGVLAYVPFAIASNAPDHDELLTLSNMLLVSAQASVVPVTVNSNAVLSITWPPYFSASFLTNAGVMHLELAGTTNRVYAIQVTTNLAPAQWTFVGTATNVSGVAPFDDVLGAGLPERFYRAQFER